MQTFPVVLTHESVDVYPDDEDPNLFYLIPSRPRLRLDGGKPVFRATFWTDDASGSTTSPSVAGLRGGSLHFDVNLGISDELQQAIVERIRDTGVQQQRVEIMEQEERERVQRMSRALGAGSDVTPRSRIPTIREPRFGSVQFTDGKVELLEEKGGDFIAWSSAGGAPSLMADNNSAFSLRLNAEAAAVWYRALEQNAAAIAVRYELKFQVRLPSLQIHVWAGSHQKLDVERSVERVVTKMDRGCDDADVERIDVQALSETLTEEGLINVEIIKGSAKISDEQVSQLRNTAIDLISDRVKEVLMHKIRGMTEAERQSSLLNKVTEEITSFAELRLTQRDVIPWGANPQANMVDFMGGIQGDARKQLVTLVDLSNPVVATLEVEVAVEALWDTDPGIARVIVRVEYPPAGTDPRAVQEFSFTKAENAVKMFRVRRAANDRGTVDYSAVAYVRGAREPIDLGRARSNGRVFVNVPELGSFKLKVRANPSMFAGLGSGKLASVQVDYEYKAEGEPDHVVDSLLLRPTELDSGVQVTKITNRVIDEPIRFRPTYLRDGAPEIVGDWQQVWVRAGKEQNVEIPLPWKDSIRVGARVLGSTAVKSVLVELKHEDGDFVSDARVIIDADDGDGAAWSGSTSLPQLDKTNQRFRYRYSVEGNDQLVVGPWVDAEGDQELVLPLLAVKLRSQRLHLGTTYTEVLVNLRYVDTSRAFEVRKEIYLHAGASDATWLVPRVSVSVDEYSYSMTLFDAAGLVTEVPERSWRGENLILSLPND
ncbi:MAG: hypothetical protein ABW352_22815 [Polyangiales bacterium]